MLGPMLVLENIACLRGGRRLFEGLSLALEPGEAALVTGPNGAGKSSLLRILAGLLEPSAGRIVREGPVALAGEAAGLDEGWPLERALGFWADLDGVPRLRRGRHSRHPELVSGSTPPPGPVVDGARWMLKRVQHDDRLFAGVESPLHAAMRAMGIHALARVPVRMLSTGQRKRAVLARTIASGAAIWLLDEPGNGLDTSALDALAGAIAAHRAGGGIVVVASHQPIGLVDPKIVAL